MRIYELAKELNIAPKEVLAFLQKEGIEGKTPSSAIEESQIDKIRKVYADKQTGTEEKKEAPPAADKTPAENAPKRKPEKSGSEKPAQSSNASSEKKTGEGALEGDEKPRPKKKSSISAVFNPANTKEGKRGQRSIVHNAGDNRQRPRDGQRPQTGPDGKPIRRPQTGPDGKPIRRPQTGPDGKPVRRPAEAGTASAGQAQKRPAEQKPAQEPARKPVHHTPPVPEFSTGKHLKDIQGTDKPAEEKKTQTGQNVLNEAARGNEKQEKRTVSKDSQSNSGDRGHRQDSRRSGSDTQNRQKESKNTGDRKPQQRVNAGASREKSRDGSGNNNNNKNKGGKNKRSDYKKGASKNEEKYVNLEKKTGHKKKNATPQTVTKEEKDEIKIVKLPEYMTVKELADRIKQQPSAIVKQLFMQGTMVTLNQEIDYEKAEEIALGFNYIAEPEERVDVIAELLKEDAEDESLMTVRPPVVCVMGHVDHGKTSLLDAIRSTHVTEREAGGITQHIGASVARINGQRITFLDTPGHEAFTAMRMRGANSTDIAVLVVAADDGIMPQTLEAISHARAAEVAIIVAINKIDKPNANIDKVKKELSENGLTPEDWGGDCICVPVSAKTGEGIDELLEMILLEAEVLELKANAKRNARGLVIEAKLDKGRGAVATVLVQKGTLKVGDPVAAGGSYGKVRAMYDHTGKRVKEAGPSTPVEIIGLNSVANAGEVFIEFDTEREARSFAETFISQGREKLIEETRARLNLDDIFSQIQAGNLKQLDLIVKADVQGSVEAVKQSLEKLSNEEVVVKVIHGGVGAISESDVSLASASNAIIIGFNVKADSTARSVADQEKVDIRLYSIIYKAIEDIEGAMKGMLEPIYEERIIGHAEIRQLFKASGVGNIAGSYVLDGVFERNCKIRLFRGKDMIYEGSLASLKRFKDDVKEVRAGYECGLVFDGFNDIAVEDQVEAYKMVEVPRE